MSYHIISLLIKQAEIVGADNRVVVTKTHYNKYESVGDRETRLSTNKYNMQKVLHVALKMRQMY